MQRAALLVLLASVLHGCGADARRSDASAARDAGAFAVSLPGDLADLVSSGQYERAVPALSALASEGDPEAAFVLGQLHLCGKGVSFSCAAAERLLLGVAEASRPVSEEVKRQARNSVAWINAACEDTGFVRDTARALHYARAALRGDDPYSIDTLAAARAQAGGFDMAVTDQRRALDVLEETARKEKVPLRTFAEFRERLDRYNRFEPARFGAEDAERYCSFLSHRGDP